MLSLWRSSLVAGLAAAALACLAPTAALGQDKFDTVTFKSADGVTLSGRFYPAGGKKDKKAVVLYLHNFDGKNGGAANKDGWPELAKSFQNAGYAVLSFDFRGFGDSKDVNKEVFWDGKRFGYNQQYIKGGKGAKPPASIDHKNFYPAYYSYLVNDVAAAKAYLDRANDRKECNSSSVIVVGAGQGATIGAMWVANECMRRKDKNAKGNVFAPPDLGGLECKDVAACLWLTLSPTVEGRTMSRLANWNYAAVKTNEIPTMLYYGKNDGKGSTNVATWIKNLPKDGVRTVPIDGSSAIGSKLLDKATNAQILKSVDGIIERRGARELVEKKVEDSAYYYQPDLKKGQPRLNKKAGDEVPPVDVPKLLTGQ